MFIKKKLNFYITNDEVREFYDLLYTPYATNPLRVSFNYLHAKDILKIEGVGRDNIVAADFMKTIEKFEPIQSVDLVSSKKLVIADMTFQQFIFSCKMKKGF